MTAHHVLAVVIIVVVVIVVVVIVVVRHCLYRESTGDQAELVERGLLHPSSAPAGSDLTFSRSLVSGVGFEGVLTYTASGI